jgi:signal transduction histidine kinase
MAEADLVAEQRRSERLRERSALARRLHDSVLQTLNLISAAADEPAEVRYLARVQERDLRRTISEYESPFEDSFRARLLEARAEVEDRYRVEIDQFIKDDAEMDETLEAMVGAAGEAMNNAARHSDSDRIDLFAEIREDTLHISVRDRGRGLAEPSDGTGISKSIVERVHEVGGTVTIRSEPGHGTEVLLTVGLR